jgi:hypothetical protein
MPALQQAAGYLRVMRMAVVDWGARVRGKELAVMGRATVGWRVEAEKDRRCKADASSVIFVVTGLSPGLCATM